jgi:hypothetical protein
MVQWNWRPVPVDAADILTSARALRMTPHWVEIDPTIELTSSAEYVSWARKVMAENTALGRDAALCYAKRAICREIDAFMMCNHLTSFLGRQYPEKIEMLVEVGLSVPDIVRELVINPRNDVEHNYVVPEDTQTRHAVQIAELFINATARERERHAIISIAWSITVHRERSCAPGNEYDRLEFTLHHQNKPMLLIDPCPVNPLVMILHPANDEVIACPLRNFKRNDAIALAKLLRQHYALAQGGHDRTLVDCDWLTTLKTQLSLPNIC